VVRAWVAAPLVLVSLIAAWFARAGRSGSREAESWGFWRAALEKGRLKRRQRRRIMSYPLVIRLMIAMTLMPDGSYCESLARLAGLLADVPFALQWHVPTEKVITDWRLLVPADVMEDLFWAAAGPLIGDDEQPAVLLAGMTVCAADRMLVTSRTPWRTGRCSARPGPRTIPPRSRSSGSWR
jgi:hypothetical protein